MPVAWTSGCQVPRQTSFRPLKTTVDATWHLGMVGVAQNSTVLRIGIEGGPRPVRHGRACHPTTGGGGDAAPCVRVLEIAQGAALDVTMESQRLIRIEGRQLRVRRSGTGPPILLLNGMGMSLSTWAPLDRHLDGFDRIRVGTPGTGGILARQPA